MKRILLGIFLGYQARAVKLESKSQIQAHSWYDDMAAEAEAQANAAYDEAMAEAEAAYEQTLADA